MPPPRLVQTPAATAACTSTGSDEPAHLASSSGTNTCPSSSNSSSSSRPMLGASTKKVSKHTALNTLQTEFAGAAFSGTLEDQTN